MLLIIPSSRGRKQLAQSRQLEASHRRLGRRVDCRSFSFQKEEKGGNIFQRSVYQSGFVYFKLSNPFCSSRMNFDLIFFAEFQAVTRRADDEEKGDGKPGRKVAKCPKRNQQILTNFLIGHVTMYCTRNQDL